MELREISCPNASPAPRNWPRKTALPPILGCIFNIDLMQPANEHGLANTYVPLKASHFWGTIGVFNMRGKELEWMSIDELWNLNGVVTLKLAQKLQSEKARLEQRLGQIQGTSSVSGLKPEHRPYPPVLPKYRNPKDPTETWSGRGKQPRWLGPQLQAGRRLDDFLIDRPIQQKKRQTA
jgi:DNA-binding protein H-NS